MVHFAMKCTISALDLSFLHDEYPLTPRLPLSKLQHIINTMTVFGWTVDGNRTFEMKTPRGQMTFTNVVATHDPAAPRRLVLACHYDSIYGRDKFVGQ